MSTVQKIERVRKPRARSKDVVLALIEERLNMLAEAAPDGPHISRLFDLTDELRRALAGKAAEDE